MRIKKTIKRDIKRRLTFCTLEPKALILKSLGKNQILPMHIREKALDILDSYPKDHSISKINNLCYMTGRSRGNMGPKNGKISRMKFRELCEFGKISGVKRATW